jgi:hypothetical protein
MNARSLGRARLSKNEVFEGARGECGARHEVDVCGSMRAGSVRWSARVDGNEIPIESS